MRESARSLVVGCLTKEMDGHVEGLGTRPAHVHDAFTECGKQVLRVVQRRLRERHGQETSHPDAGVDACDGDGTADGVDDGATAGAPEHGSAPVSLM